MTKSWEIDQIGIVNYVITLTRHGGMRCASLDDYVITLTRHGGMRHLLGAVYGREGHPRASRSGVWAHSLPSLFYSPSSSGSVPHLQTSHELRAPGELCVGCDSRLSGCAESGRVSRAIAHAGRTKSSHLLPRRHCKNHSERN